jgi:hypothetical protein
VPFGAAATFGGCVIDGSVYWLASNKSGLGPVVRAAGFAPTAISLPSTVVQLSNFSTVSDAFADTYQEHGHTFFLLTFPTAKTTLVYDASESRLGVSERWHERGTWISGSNEYVAWRPLYHSYVFGQHRWLDREIGTIWRSDAALGFDVDDRPVRRVRQAPNLFDDHDQVFVSRFEVELEAGLGLTSGQGVNPQVMLRVSKDGGKTWGMERTRSAGALGDYQRRVQWLRCGSGPFWAPEISVSDPIPWRILGAHVDLRAKAAG